jgi:hypothetical protein
MSVPLSSLSLSLSSFGESRRGTEYRLIPTPTPTATPTATATYNTMNPDHHPWNRHTLLSPSLVPVIASAQREDPSPSSNPSLSRSLDLGLGFSTMQPSREYAKVCSSPIVRSSALTVRPLPYLHLDFVGGPTGYGGELGWKGRQSLLLNLWLWLWVW